VTMSKCILFLTPQLPYPPHQGATLRNYGLIGALAARGHRLALLSFVEPGQPLVASTPLAAACYPAQTIGVPTRSNARRLADLLIGYPDMARRLWSPAFDETLRDLLVREQFDAVHIEGIEMAPYLPTLKRLAADATLIYDAHNAEYALQARIAQTDRAVLSRLPLALYSSIQARRLARFETETCRAVNHVFACSEADADLLRQLPHRTPITVIPNAIHIAEYQETPLPRARLIHPALVFTGKMDFRPNIDAVLWFAAEVFPLVRDKIPQAHFTVVGQKPHTRLSLLYGQPGITLTGLVPDIRPYIQSADVFVVPMRMGSGTRLKMLEAMAMRRAIVSTTLGAEGLPVTSGQHLILADDPQAFAQAIVDLLLDENARQAMGQAAAQLVQEQFDWSAVIPTVESAYP